MISLGQQVKILRTIYNIDQLELAAKTGIDRRYLSQFENGHTMLKDEEIQKIGSLFREKGVPAVLTIHLDNKLAIAA